MAQPLNVLTSCHGNSSSNSRRRTGFHGCARCKKPTMSLEHLSSQTCIRTLERQLMVWWLYRCLKTKGTMWTANNAQYYSTIHSLRLTSIQAVPDVWLGTKVDSPDDNIILRPPGVDGTYAEISSYTSRFAIAAFRSLVSNSESHTTIYNTVKTLIIEVVLVQLGFHMCSVLPFVDSENDK